MLQNPIYAPHGFTIIAIPDLLSDLVIGVLIKQHTFYNLFWYLKYGISLSDLFPLYSHVFYHETFKLLF